MSLGTETRPLSGATSRFVNDKLIAEATQTSPVGALPSNVLEERCARILLPASSSQTRFRNWGGTFNARPTRVYKPRTAQHVLEVVELARRKRVQVRAVGRAHSPSDLPFTKDWALRMEGLKGTLKIDATHLTATFLAGTYVSDVHDALASHSPPLALGNVGSISEQTIGGLISTASHGTGITLPVISANVQEISLIAPMGASTSTSADGGAQLITCSRKHRPELFNATLCGLGATGIIVTVKLAVVPAFRLKQAWEEVPFDSIFGSGSTHLSKEATRQQDELGLNPIEGDYVGFGSAGKLSIGRLIAGDKPLPPSPFRYAPWSRSRMSSNTGQVWPLEVATPGEANEAGRPHRVHKQTSQAPVLDHDPEFDEVTSQAQTTLESVVESVKHTRIMWFPQSHMCTVLRAVPTEQPSTPPSLTQRLHHKLVGYHLTQLLLFVARYNQRLPVPIARLVFRLTHPAIPEEVKAGTLLRVPSDEHERRAQGGPAPPVPQKPEFLKTALVNLQQQGLAGTGAAPSSSADSRPTRLDIVPFTGDRITPLNTKHAHGEVVDTSWRVLNMDCLFPQYTDEWAIPYAFAGACIRAMRDWLAEEEAQPDGARVHFPVEIRFTDADGIFLSPSTGRKTCYIGIVQFRPYNLPVRYRVLFRRYERLLRYFGGRPHWAKTHSCSREEIAAMYPHLDDWLAVREQVDPERVLANPYIRRHLLGEVGEQVDARVFKSRL